MSKGISQAYVHGSLALDIAQAKPNANVIAFTHAVREGRVSKLRDSYRRTVLHGSEMYCSLVKEGFDGCAYNVLTPAQSRALAAVLVFIGTVCAIVGA